ncbi:MAG: VacJ family lipoprotein, partial [Proteobacteria bacterium]|nr:VacJ family lipoprotein [Pseudomonadota bacterium]
MTARIAVCLLLAALLLMGAGSVFASDAAQPDGTVEVAQFSDMKGHGAAADAKNAVAEDDVDDFDE